MISICIPVYNTNVIDLIKDLAGQIKNLPYDFGIIVVDDGSDVNYQEKNNSISKSSFVQYHQLPINKGRIEARKHLATIAKYDWLLFIDADSNIINNDFLYNYLTCCNGKNDVIVGGRVYSTKPPTDCNLMLHWKYGTKREKALKGRFVFMTNNFCIRKEIFQQIDFPAALQGYGHEDTWMGIKLKEKNAVIEFIENPVLHDGLEKAVTFIEKSKNALQNLKALEEITDIETLQNHVKLFRYYNIIQKFRINRLLIFSESFLHQTILKNLVSCQASLLLFDFFRLSYFTKLKRNQPLSTDW